MRPINVSCFKLLCFKVIILQITCNTAKELIPSFIHLFLKTARQINVLYFSSLRLGENFIQTKLKTYLSVSCPLGERRGAGTPRRSFSILCSLASGVVGRNSSGHTNGEMPTLLAFILCFRGTAFALATEGEAVDGKY